MSSEGETIMHVLEVDALKAPKKCLELKCWLVSSIASVKLMVHLQHIGSIRFQHFPPYFQIEALGLKNIIIRCKCYIIIF